MKFLYLLLLVAPIVLGVCEKGDTEEEMQSNNGRGYKKATIAGGCFWCMEPPFERIPGVIDVVPGYTGGKTEDPTYEEVCSGATGHLEAIQITYDQDSISYDELLDVFWRQIDPTDAGGQFVDRGNQYRSAIFYHDEEQKNTALVSRDRLAGSGMYDKPVVTDIKEYTVFYPAEDYHHDYYKKCPVRYTLYKKGSGREKYLEKVWGNNPVVSQKTFTKPDMKVLKKELTPLQYRVTQQCGTEPPFQNEYWDNKRDGIYVDIVSGEVLFSSRDKFESGSGWPSFTKPLESENIIEHADSGMGMIRTEVRSKDGDSHLGHVFSDGPGPTGLRYCINSASLRFIPKEDFEKEGYEEYFKVFKD